MIIDAIGIDAAFANMGFARVRIDVTPGKTPSVQCLDLVLVSTESEAGKVVRKSSDRLRRGQELREAMVEACQGCSFAFAEVPSGTQSAVAAFGLGIAVGILAGCPIPIIEVSPMEVKEAVAGQRVKKGATKAEVIAWAEKRWPSAPWRRAKNKSVTKNGTLPAGRLTDDNEHLADAMATVVAGMATPEFKRLIALAGTSHAIPSTPHIGLTPNRPARNRVSLDAIPLAGKDLPGGEGQILVNPRRPHRRQG